ncbi:MAG: U32 family peptidase [Acholeplasma sp.]|nr:U32 family peptidase [Acholeplasma sp.]
MKRLITIYDLISIEKISNDVDGFIVGSDLFSTRLTKSFSIEEINTIIDICISIDKEVFLIANQMFTDQQLEDFVKNIKKISYTKLTGIIIADIGALVSLSELGINDKVIYNPETLLTNSIDFNYLSDDNVFGAYVAKEITLDDILTIGKEKKHQLFMLGHGHLNMFYSKRKLLDNYQEFVESNQDLTNLQNLKIIEPKREDNPYPILQDGAGTHVFRSKVMNSLDYLDQLKEVVDYLVIDTIFKNDDYGIDVAKLYNKKYDKNAIESFINKYNEEWDNGFLDRKTYYKR